MSTRKKIEAQREESRVGANRTRAARSKIKIDIGSGKLDPCDVLANLPPELAGMRVFDFVRCIPKVGPIRSEMIIRDLEISIDMPFADLSNEKHQQLSTHIAHRKRAYEELGENAIKERQKRDWKVALGIGNRLRSIRSKIKIDIGSGKLDPCDVLANLPPELAGMRVLEFIVCIPHLGPACGKKVIYTLGLSNGLRLSVLSTKRRAELASELARCMQAPQRYARAQQIHHKKKQHPAPLIKNVNRSIVLLARIKKQVKNGSLAPWELLAALPPEFAGMRVSVFLESVNGVNTERSKKIMRGLGIPQDMRLSRLTTHGCQDLAKELAHDKMAPTELVEGAFKSPRPIAA